jgi:hypothetical protein
MHRRRSRVVPRPRRQLLQRRRVGSGQVLVSEMHVERCTAHTYLCTRSRLPICALLRKPLTRSSPHVSPRVVSADLSRVAASETSRLGGKARTPEGRDDGDVRRRCALGMIHEARITEKTGSGQGMRTKRDIVWCRGEARCARTWDARKTWRMWVRMSLG